METFTITIRYKMNDLEISGTYEISRELDWVASDIESIKIVGTDYNLYDLFLNLGGTHLKEINMWTDHVLGEKYCTP